MHDFTPVSALIGGALIGLSASVVLLASGRVAGISGILGGLLRPQPGDVGWRLAFVVGLFAAGGVMLALAPDAFGVPTDRSVPAVAVAGVLVGFGTRLGNGCTSGHGVCGLSRLSTRSLVATVTFMATGFLTALVVTQVFGGSL
jgi:hypothetical protein